MKEYDEWNEVKKHTQQKKRKLGMKSREIFWVKIGHNIGSEEYGKGKDFARPVIIVRRLTSDLFIGIPITTTIKNNDYFHAFTYDNKSRGMVENSAMILQVKTFSIKRVLSKIGTVNKESFDEILEKTKSLFNPT
jgi:mRNA interferase MazF